MGQYKISVYFKWQFGFLLINDFDYSMIELNLPLIQICFGLDKTAKGILIFNKEF